MGIGAGMAYKLGSGISGVAMSAFGRSSQQVGKITPVNPVIDAPNPYVYNPYESNPMEGLWTLQQEASDTQAGILESEGDILAAEGNREAQLHARDVGMFREQQALQYGASGVRAEMGSPMAVMNETVSLGEEEVNAIQRRASMQQNLRYQQAGMVRNQGRATLLANEIQFQSGKNQFEANKAFGDAQYAYSRAVHAASATPGYQPSRATGKGGIFAAALSELGSLVPMFSGSSWGVKKKSSAVSRNPNPSSYAVAPGLNDPAQHSYQAPIIFSPSSFASSNRNSY